MKAKGNWSVLLLVTIVAVMCIGSSQKAAAAEEAAKTGVYVAQVVAKTYEPDYAYNVGSFVADIPKAAEIATAVGANYTIIGWKTEPVEDARVDKMMGRVTPVRFVALVVEEGIHHVLADQTYLCYDNNSTTLRPLAKTDTKTTDRLAVLLTQMAYKSKGGLNATAEVIERSKGTAVEVRLTFPSMPALNSLGQR